MKGISYFVLRSLKPIPSGIALFSLLLLFFTTCKTPEQTIVVPNVAVSSMPGYTVRDSLISRTDFNVWLVTTETRFDSLFSTDITSSYRPKFAEEVVVAIKAQTATTTYKVSFKQMLLQGRILHVYFKVKKEVPDAEDAGWVAITAFPKNQDIRKVNFYHDNVLIRSIPVVIVY